MPPNKDTLISFVGNVGNVGNEGRGTTGSGEYYGESPETEAEHKANKERYLCVEVKASNPRDVLCFDKVEQKMVWGKYTPFGRSCRLSIFIPNI